MARCVRYALLGAHPVDVGMIAGAAAGEFFDAFDAVAELEDGRLAVVGLRTSDYVAASPEPEWPDGYRPLAVTLDFSTVTFYDFNQIMWLGPEPHACLIWSNAIGLRAEGIDHLLAPRAGSALFDGPDHRGLPSPDDLGITVAGDLDWRHVREFAGTDRTRR